LDRIEAETIQNDLTAQEEERKLKEQYDQRIIGQDEYQNKLKIIKDKQISHQKELDDKKRKLANKQALFDKAQTLFNIGLSTREAIMKIDAAYAANPPLAAFLIAAQLVFAAAQAAFVVASNPPTAHEGESFVKRRKGDGSGLKSYETIRTLKVGERVVRDDVNARHFELFEAANSGDIERYIYHKYITPALIAQNKKHQEANQKSFAENIANSFMMNSQTSDAISERVFQKLWKSGIKIRNIEQLSEAINQGNSNPYRRI
jgi:hypothetical protein